MAIFDAKQEEELLDILLELRRRKEVPIGFLFVSP